MRTQIIQKLSEITEEEQELLQGNGEIDKGLYQSEPLEEPAPGSYVIDSKKLLDAGKLITIRKHTRFAHFPAHTHNYVEVIYMCEGQTHHIINGKDVYLKKGELLFLNQNSIQEIYPATEQDVAVNFIVLPEFFDRALHMMNPEENPLRSFVLDCMTGENKEADYLHFQVADVIPVQNLVENLIWTLMNPTQNKRSISQFTMGLLLLELMNCADSVAVDSGTESQKLMLQVLQYAEEHYRDGELSDLAELLHYDLYWLSREIKRQTGQTYTEIVQAKRLSQACYLLKTTKKSVADIAGMIGYENVSYFHRIFQKKYGMTPRQYRQDCK
ncbi:MAG: AraC family transcriptional regulator [Lachnospiraceae bacterium]|nr:AraC family transcriptional regulator [Lachnospiraceae bacterium]MDD6193146.1 AraC family transcriptional regulator [Lachnospiraceae bacterium]MDY4794336.1 AraC family transcriptional regulator [Pararoseburia sp.]